MRCAEHDLALGPDGECVLCRRRRLTASAALASPPGDRRWVILGSVGAGLIGVLLVAVLLAGALGALGLLAPRGELTQAPVTTATTDEVAVTVYVTRWCPHCKRATAWLDSQGIPYAEFDVERDRAAAREMRQLNPRGGVPVIVVDETVLVGFDPGALERALSAAERRRTRE